MIVEALSDTAEKKQGIDIRTESTVKELLKDEKVVGVKVEHKGQVLILIKAKAVITATGGFGANPAVQNINQN